MTINLFQTPEYKAIISDHISKTIGYLLNKNQEFALACQVEHLDFNPELPKDLKESFHDTVLFILSGYTLESAALEDEYFSFEAGFGPENFGSTVTVPLLAIKQILVGENPIVLNMAEFEKNKAPEATKIVPSKNSMDALLKNPENKKLLKKRK